MEIIDQNRKIAIIIAALIIVLIILSITVFLISRIPQKPTGNITPISQPVSSTTTPISTPDSTALLSATPIPPFFTGAKDDAPPEEETNFVDQKSDLINKSPISQPTFTVSYNYDTDKIDVQLAEPKDQSRQQFDQWLQATYPLIPLDRFVFN